MKDFGKNLAVYRRKKGFTQASLAEKMCVSDKAVSKWENGLGYPDITLLPLLARTLGVSVDTLLSDERSGVVFAGTLLTDIVNNIGDYPKAGALVYIDGFSRAIGGCAANTSVDFATIDNRIPVSVIGRVSDDDNGDFVLSALKERGIDVSGVKASRKYRTGVSNVMSCPKGERTFFIYIGANDEFCPADIDLRKLSCKILHVGYVGLMKAFDAPDETYGTVLARFLHDAKQAGVKTSVDVVTKTDLSEYPELMIPALKYTDYFIANELECCAVFGAGPYDKEGKLDVEAIAGAMRKAMECGVGEKVIVHCKEAGFCLDKSGKFTAEGSLVIPKELIKGSVGAGDAFCAGCLYGIYNDYDDESILDFASRAAACNLFSENSVDGMRSRDEIFAATKDFAKRKIN